MEPYVSSANPVAVYPEDRFPGCLPRKSQPGQYCPMAAEHIPVIPRSDWASVAAKLGDGKGLRPFVVSILDQDGAGSCATESTTGAVKIGRAFAGLPFVELNPWFIYRVTSGGRDSGSSIDENLAFVRENGIAPESLHPRSKGWRGTPSEEAKKAAQAYRIVEFYDVSTVDEFVSCLLHGYPVVHGASGHSICAVSHIDESSKLDLNSWGSDWGDGGFGKWCSYRGINWGYGAFAVRTTTESLSI
jgi:hypothetical protein